MMKSAGFIKTKSVLASLSLAGLLAVAGVLPVMADNSYPVCAVNGCGETIEHVHDGICYAGHTLEDGHDYHAVCQTRGCTETAGHIHDGVCYSGHHEGDGHDGCASVSRSTGSYSHGHHSSHRRGCHR